MVPHDLNLPLGLLCQVNCNQLQFNHTIIQFCHLFRLGGIVGDEVLSCSGKMDTADECLQTELVEIHMISQKVYR